MPFLGALGTATGLNLMSSGKLFSSSGVLYIALNILVSNGTSSVSFCRYWRCVAASPDSPAARPRFKYFIVSRT